MLGRLIQTAASYGKSSTALESATEEAHTRNLLYGSSQNVYPLAPSSPPPSPFNSTQPAPMFRPGSFDDRGGLELEEKDLRILIAQDAHGMEEKPTILFDSKAPAHSTASHGRHASTAQLGQRSPLPNDWRPSTGQSPWQTSPQSDLPFRNRSSTLSNASTSWTKQARDAGTREEAFLECMFGVTSATKVTSTIKLHVVPGTPKVPTPGIGRGNTIPDLGDQNARRAPLVRSRTAVMGSRAQGPGLVIGNDSDTSTNDVVLVTRLFHVALTEAIGTTVKDPQSSGQDPAQSASPVPMADGEGTNQHKKPKLVQRKVPAFAIGLILYLPRSADHKFPVTRPSSQSAHAVPMTGGLGFGSLGTDMSNPWTFPVDSNGSSFSPSKSAFEDSDRRIDSIVNNWDVILRAIALLEREAAGVIHEQLERSLGQMVSSTPKATPKEKSMQRINQRIVSVTDLNSIARKPLLKQAAKHMLRRVCYALRIPRVTTGLGFAVGHWSEETRTLYRMCGRRQHNFFLFNLLTAFLGQHTQWLQRLAPDWYCKQFRIANKKRSDPQVISQRTVIVSDQRAIARRLVFVLASFVPGQSTSDGLHKVGDDPLLTKHFSTSSPSSQVTRNESLRRTANRRVRESRLQANPDDKTNLSTSASSADSATRALPRDRSSRYLVRRDSDCLSIRGPQATAVLEAEHLTRKASAVSASTMTPHPATPVPHFSIKQDSYFPDGALAETHESVASADLAKILRRSSSSTGGPSNLSSRWGSLVSGISDLWSTRPPQSSGTSSGVPGSPIDDPLERRNARLSPAKGSSSNPLQDMVDQLDGRKMAMSISARGPRSRVEAMSPHSSQTAFKPFATAPRLRVDDKDGVIDVDLDFPGFAGFSSLPMENSFTSPTRRSHRPSTTSFMDGAESIRSLRSIPAQSQKAPVADQTCVAGFLRRHHEDFSLFAVKPYPELEEEIKRSMLMEDLPPRDWQRASSHALDEVEWVDVCTTLVADVRNSTIRRITLRRKLRRPSQVGPAAAEFQSEWDGGSGQRPASQQDHQQAPVLDRREALFVEEEVKDFDAMLADAVERVLNLAEAIHPLGTTTTTATTKTGGVGGGHARSASMNTTMTGKSSILGTSVPGGSGGSNGIDRDAVLPMIVQDYVKQDCRQVVVGALEEVVKDVTEELGKLQKGRNIGERERDRDVAPPPAPPPVTVSVSVSVPTTTSAAAAAAGGGASGGETSTPKTTGLKQQDNILREGIKRWLIDVEQTKIW